MNKNIEVQMSKALMSQCRQWGTEREEENTRTGTKNKKAYAHNKRLPYTSLQASRLAVVGEAAVLVKTGGDVDTHVWVVKKVNGKYPPELKKDADLTAGGVKIEVRNCADPSAPIPVYPKDIAADALVVQVHVEWDKEDQRPTGRVFITGWVWAKTAKRIGTKTDLGYWEVANKDKKAMFLCPVKGLQS